MAVDLRKDLEARYGVLLKSIEEIEKKMQSFPEGRINVRTRSGKSYYYLARSDSSDKYLSRDENEFIEQLLQKDYLNRVLKRAKKELAAIEKMMTLYPDKLAEDIFDLLPEGRKRYIKPINAYDDAYAQKWMSAPYKRKPCGRMGEADYKENMVERTNDYSEAGIVLGERLFYTFESDKTPLDLRTLDRIIDTHFR